MSGYIKPDVEVVSADAALDGAAVDQTLWKIEDASVIALTPPKPSLLKIDVLAKDSFGLFRTNERFSLSFTTDAEYEKFAAKDISIKNVGLPDIILGSTPINFFCLTEACA